MNDPLSRRQFIQLSAAAAASILMTNCASNPSSQKILVIGAGMAGLAAGRTLQDAGYSVTILEGRDRIGGRVWTSKLWPDAPMDMGASWIHGIRRNPITALADEISAPRLETDYDNGIIYGADGDLLGDRAWAKYEGYYEDIQTAIRRAARQDEDVSIEQAVQDYFDLVSMTAQDRQHLEHVLNSALEQEWSGSVSQLSAQNIEDGTGFGGPDVIFPEGYGAIPEYLAQRLDIQLNETVKKVSYSDVGVIVETESGSFSADRVIVTLPLGILKKGSVVFDPPLPAEKQTVINQMGVGVLNKTYLRFAEPFWQRRPEWISRLAENRGEWSEWFNIRHYTDIPIILGFNAADFGTKLEAWSDDQIISEAMGVLRSMYGADIPEPESAQITRWIADPFAAGSYSFPAVGAPANARSTLAESVADRLFFAGEATHSDYPATVHGAYLSGIREAEKVMQS